VYQWIWPLMTRFTADTMIGRKLRHAARRTDPLVGIDAANLRIAGIERVGKLTDVRDGLPYCDGISVDPEVVVWCTGFAPDYRWIDLPIFGADGYPRHRRGIVPDVPGLYFLGQRFQHRMTSALIGGVGNDAAYVVDDILRDG
jgi:putative flavoprotein involved in K+ transport